MSSELDIHLDVLPIRGGEEWWHRGPEGAWKVRLIVFSGPDFKSPHAKLGCICRDETTAERIRAEVAAALQEHPPRLEGDQVIVDVPVLLAVREGEVYPEVPGLP